MFLKCGVGEVAPPSVAPHSDTRTWLELEWKSRSAHGSLEATCRVSPPSHPPDAPRQQSHYRTDNSLHPEACLSALAEPVSLAQLCRLPQSLLKPVLLKKPIGPSCTQTPGRESPGPALGPLLLESVSFTWFTVGMGRASVEFHARAPVPGPSLTRMYLG